MQIDGKLYEINKKFKLRACRLCENIIPKSSGDNNFYPNIMKMKLIDNTLILQYFSALWSVHRHLLILIERYSI